MGRNSKINKSNQASKKQPQKPTQPQSPALKMKDTYTSEEREELRKIGEEEKAAYIKEGEVEMERLIAEGEKRKAEIIKEAEEAARSREEEIKESYRSEVRESALAEAAEECKKIKEEAEKIRKEAEDMMAEAVAKKEEADAKAEETERRYADLTSKMEQYAKDVTELEKRKKTYKTDVLQEVNLHIQELQKNIEELEAENQKLKKDLKTKERELASSNADKDFYMTELEEADVRKTRLMEAEHEIESLKAKNELTDDLYRKCKEENERYYSQIQSFGHDPSVLIDKNNHLEEENRELRDKLAAVPSGDEIVYLRKISEEYEKTVTELVTLKNEKIENERRLAEFDIYINDLENSERFIRILELQRSELQRELDRIQADYSAHKSNVFAALSAIDSEPIPANYSDSGRSLSNICKDFRNYLASREENPLFYTEAAIRTFFAGLASSRILILQGMSGTGKSSLPKAFEDYMKSVTDRVEVQSSWRDRNDLLGFYNDFEKRYKETKFLEALYRATRDRNNIHLILLDEMNLSRIEYYFADFLSVLEEEKPEKWKISLISRDVTGAMPEYIQEGELPIGENTWFIGTANKDDSTSTITDKVYDRAIVLDFEERGEEFDAPQANAKGVSYSELNRLFSDAIKLTPEMKKEIKTMVEWLDEHMRIHFEISFGNRISRQINMFVPAYIKCGGKIEEAIDIIFSTKVLRKLQGYYDDATKEGMEDFLGELKSDQKFSKLAVTIRTLKKMIARI